MNEETATSALNAGNEVLTNLRGLEPTLATLLVVVAGFVTILYLVMRYGKQQTQPTGDLIRNYGAAVTEITEQQKLINRLQAQLGEFQVQLNQFSYQLKEKDQALDGLNKKLDDVSKLLQAKELRENELQLALNEANKKLDEVAAILRAKEAHEAELTRENAEQREAIKGLQRQLTDLQFQLDQALRKQTVIVQAEDTPHEPEALTPSPDL